MAKVTKNLPHLIQIVVKTYNDLQLLLDYSKGSFLVSGHQKMTADFLLSFMCFRKR
jgi:hypothetical protein